MKPRAGVFGINGGVWVQVPRSQALSQTIRDGLNDISHSIQGVCFVPGDQVGITLQTMIELTYRFITETPDFLLPSSQDVTGSPVFFHRSYFKDLFELKGEQGGKVVLNRFRDCWIKYQVETSFFDDLDTMEDYTRLQNNG